MRNKRNIIAILFILALCLFVPCCCKEGEKGKDDINIEKTEEQADEASATGEASSGDAEGAGGEEGKTHILTTEDGGASVKVRGPEGYDLMEYSSDVNLSFEKTEGTFGSVITMRLLSGSEADAADALLQEIQYMVSANSTGDSNIGEIQTVAEGEYQVSYVDYSYDASGTMAEGRRIFMTLGNGSIYVYAVENIGGGLQDASTEISSVVSSIS